MKKFGLVLLFTILVSVAASAQVAAPRESQRQEIYQTLGDAKIGIVYHRPNTKGRKIWGDQVPYGEIWRAGANENTTIEFSRDVTINGQPLPAGKYGFHAMPTKADWILIFNKANDQWGSFTYDAKKDALRVTVKPVKSEFEESLSYSFHDVTPNTAKVVLRWKRLAVPFTVDIGDIHGRVLKQYRDAIAARKADDIRPLSGAAGYVMTFKLQPQYSEAIGWLDEALKVRETFGLLATKTRILAAMGKKQEAIATGEKAIAVGKAANPPANTADFEKILNEIKAGK